MKSLKLHLLIVLIFMIQIAAAQDGSPYQTDFNSNDESMSENYSICNDKDGILIIANRKGILTYDADEWKIIKTPELPLVVAENPKGDKVFVGCRNNIGYLQKNELGDYEYISIGGRETGFVTQIAFQKDYVYFMSQSVITRVKINDEKDVRYWMSKSGYPFMHLVSFSSKLFVDVEKSGLQLISEKGPVQFLDKFSLNGLIVFSVQYNANTVLIGATDNKCYLFDGKNLKNFTLQDQQYISDGKINGGKLLDKDKCVISTYGAGCLVFELKTGKTVFTVNYQTGLPDDEIYALNTDKNHGIWMAHCYGLTRIDAEIPVKNYTTFKGLNGNLQAVEFFNNKLFVGTSNGIYFLDKKKDYVEYVVKQAPEIKVIEPIKTTTTVAVSPDKSKKGFLGKLFSKKKSDGTIEKTETEERTKSSIWNFLGNKEKINSQKKTYKIASVTHVFSKVPGFEHKCRQLLIVNNQLIAVTMNGLFAVSESGAKAVLPDIETNYVFSVPSENKLYLCTNKGVLAAKPSSVKWETTKFLIANDEPVYSFAKDVFDNYWLGAESKVYKVKLKKDGSIKEQKVFNFSSEFRERVIVRISNKKPLFFMSSGIYAIYKDSIQSNLNLSNFIGTETKYYFAQQDYTWIRNNNKWARLSANAEADSTAPDYLNMFDNITCIYSDNNQNLWIISDNLNIYKLDQKGIASYSSDFNAFIKRFSGMSGEKFSLNGVELSKSQHSLKIHICAPYFIKKYSNQYQYKVKGFDWSEWQSTPEINLMLGSGNHEIKVRAKNIFGKLSNEQTLKFYINPPFYASWWFILICMAIAVYAVYMFIKFREQNLLKEKQILEEKVRERTQQIAEQKEQIEMQYNALAIQNEEIETQRNKIAEQNREIKDSIYYAKRIQTAVMPDSAAISTLLSDYFVLFRPKDIVSGDFYWIFKKNEKIYVAAADCTGHGVPGGFLSMLGISTLNEITAIDKEFKANELLNLLKARLKNTLVKEGHSEEETKDGMDIALCIIDRKNYTMEYAGANNPLFMVRNKELLEFPPDKMPIGTYLGEKESFTNNEIKLDKNDMIYLFSDGYKDQLGGENIKRLKTSGFRKLLLDVHGLPMKKQKEELEQFFDKWKGEQEQMDDIMVFGIRL